MIFLQLTRTTERSKCIGKYTRVIDAITSVSRLKCEYRSVMGLLFRAYLCETNAPDEQNTVKLFTIVSYIVRHRCNRSRTQWCIKASKPLLEHIIYFFNFLLFIYLFIIMNTHLLFNLPFNLFFSLTLHAIAITLCSGRCIVWHSYSGQ